MFACSGDLVWVVESPWNNAAQARIDTLALSKPNNPNSDPSLSSDQPGQQKGIFTFATDDTRSTAGLERAQDSGVALVLGGEPKPLLPRSSSPKHQYVAGQMISEGKGNHRRSRSNSPKKERSLPAADKNHKTPHTPLSSSPAAVKKEGKQRQQSSSSSSSSLLSSSGDKGGKTGGTRPNTNNPTSASNNNNSTNAGRGINSRGVPGLLLPPQDDRGQDINSLGPAAGNNPT